MLTSRRLKRSGPAAEDGLRTASRSCNGRTGVGARSRTIVRTGGTVGEGRVSAGAGSGTIGSAARGTPGQRSPRLRASAPSLTRLKGSMTISSGLIDHNLYRHDFGHQNTEISGFAIDL